MDRFCVISNNIVSEKELKRRSTNVYKDQGSRCNNQNNKSYHRYGGRGIKRVWSRKEFREFYVENIIGKEWVRPSVDRIDNNGDYRIENCQIIEMDENSGKHENTDRKIRATKINIRKALQKNFERLASTLQFMP